MSREKLPELFVERVALDEASEHEKKRVREGLGPELDECVEQLRLEDQVILTEHPPAAFAEAVRQRQPNSGRRRAAWLGVPPVALAAALLLWWQSPDDVGVVGPTPVEPVAAAEQPKASVEAGVRLKGGQARLSIYRLAAGGKIEPTKDGTRVDAGDMLQLSYVAGGETRGVVASVDGRGAVTLHFPERKTDEPALKSDGEMALGHAYELDDAPAFERFFFVTSGPADDRPVRVDEVLVVLRGLAAGPDADTSAPTWPVGWAQTSTVLRKR